MRPSEALRGLGTSEVVLETVGLLTCGDGDCQKYGRECGDDKLNAARELLESLGAHGLLGKLERLAGSPVTERSLCGSPLTEHLREVCVLAGAGPCRRKLESLGRRMRALAALAAELRGRADGTLGRLLDAGAAGMALYSDVVTVTVPVGDLAAVVAEYESGRRTLQVWLLFSADARGWKGADAIRDAVGELVESEASRLDAAVELRRNPRSPDSILLRGLGPGDALRVVEGVAAAATALADAVGALATRHLAGGAGRRVRA